MYTKNDNQPKAYEILCPELLGRISKNKTLDTLLLMGDIDFGFFAEQIDLFSDAVIGAFQKNDTIKTIIFNKLSLNAINFLLPALSKIDKLILNNIAPDDVLLICNSLSNYMPIVPEIILGQCDDIESHAAVNNFNKQRMSLLQSINPHKRSLNQSVTVESAPKRQRLNPVNEELNITTYAMQIAVLQNPELFCNFMKFLHPNTNIQQPDNSQQTQSLHIEYLEFFKKIHQTYLECAPSLSFEEPKVTSNHNKKSKNLRIEFLNLATKDNCPEYKKFIPMLEKKSGSRVLDLRAHALFLAAQHGNRDAVNRLLGGRVRLVVGEPTAENIEAVLAEREILIIQRESNIALKTANLAFKNSEGFYQEESIGRTKIAQSLFANSQTLCYEQGMITSFIKMLRKLNASQSFLKRAYIISEADLKTAFILALQNGHLPVLYDILDFIHEYDEFSYYKQSVTVENCFSNFLNYLTCFATENGYIQLFNLIASHNGNTLSHTAIAETAIVHNKPEILDCLFSNYYFSDEDINSYFKFALHSNNTMAIQSYFLNPDKGLFYSVAAKKQSFEVHVIRNQDDHPVLEKQMEDDSGMRIYIFVRDSGFTLGVISIGEYKEFEIREEKQSNLIKNILAPYNNASMFSTSGWTTRHLRLLLVSLGVNTLCEYDPFELAKLMDNLDVTGHGNVCCPDIKSLELFMQHEYFDLSKDDNQLLKSLVQLCYSVPDFYKRKATNGLFGLSNMILLLLNDVRVNPLCPAPYTDLDFYVRGVKYSIENGYSDVLPLVLHYRPEGSLTLSQMFLSYPQLMKDALHTAMQNNHGWIINIVIKSLVFVQPTDVVIRQIRDISRKCNEINGKLRQPDLQDNIKIELNEELTKLKDVSTPLKQKLMEDVSTNNKIISVLLSSPLVFKSKTPQEWEFLFKELMKTNIAIHPKVLDYVIGWSKMKVWSELKYQQGFFHTQNQFLPLPKEILDEIEKNFLSVHRRP